MYGAKENTNYYEVLEVAYDAPQHEVHKAYTRAKATYAQDNPALYSMFTRDEARDLLKLIEEAYAVLGNHGLRRNYDDSLMKAGAARKASLVSVPRPVPSMQEAQADHNALPDFMVPDPSIPGSFGEEPPPGFADYSSPQIHQVASPQPAQFAQAQPAQFAQAQPAQFAEAQMQPTKSNAHLMDPIHAAATGKRESILVTNADFTVRTRESDIPLMPPDTGKCPLGTYKLDSAMETEISGREEFDGPFLQKVRLYKQVSLEKLSVSSRIGKTYLIALESNDFKNLPAPVFLRGFLVQMGKQLGLPEAKVVSSYMSLAKASGKYGS